MKSTNILFITIAVLILGFVGLVVYVFAGSTPVKNTPSTTSVEESNPVYSMEQVETHRIRSDCWTVIDGSVYDLTSFIANHPGGERILEACGINATQLFKNQGLSESEATEVRETLDIPESQFFHSPEAQRILESLKIGILEE